MGWLKRFLGKQKDDPAPAPIEPDDLVNRTIDRLVQEMIWSSDGTFSSRDEIIDFIYKLVEAMRKPTPAVEETGASKKLIKLVPVIVPKNINMNTRE